MGGYDSVGWVDETPGGPVHAEGYGAPGSVPPGLGVDAGAGGVERDAGRQVVVSVVGASLVNADTFRVGDSDTLVPAESVGYGQGSDVLTGVPAGFLGRTSDGRGSAGQHDHPNSMWRDR